MNRPLIFALFLAAALVPLSAAEDVHFIQPDDYFFSEEPLGENAWIHVYLGKMLSAASDKSRGEALFLRVTDGRKIWTKHFFKTRRAADGDFKLNQQVIVFDQIQDDIYLAPKKKEDARRRGWFMAVITDISDLHKDFITTSGGYKVSLKNLRVFFDDKSVKPANAPSGRK